MNKGIAVDKQEYSVTRLRRQLLENGYTPLANHDKACYLERWPTIQVNERVVTRWGRMRKYQGTGLRVENGLCVIDIDVNDPAIDDICEAMLGALPVDLKPHRLERTGKGYKIAWFCRTNELFTRLHTRRWVRVGASSDDDTHCVEIFGGSSPRQFGAFGPHTIDDKGDVKVSYKWVDESPETTPFEALDILTKDQLHRMIDVAEKEFALRGFEPVSISKFGESTPSRVYDLVEEMSFDLQNGDTVSFEELERLVRDGFTGRCSASFLEGEQAVNRSRCIIGRTAGGSVSIWESAAGETHLPARNKPKDRNDRIDRAQEAIQREINADKNRIKPDDDVETCAAKLLETYAFLPHARNPIIPLDTASLDESINVQNFRLLHNPWKSVELGPRGGERIIHPVNLFMDSCLRKNVRGVHTRPDKPCPIYEENGYAYVNTYHPPALGSGEEGSAEMGKQFMKQLAPNKGERKWFMQWLAYKWQNPHVPGPGVIMVARDMGTGRGTFKYLLEKLFGRRYVSTVPFKSLAGSGSQSQYTDWAANAIFAVVNESSSGREVSNYKSKHDLYELLKELVEPRQAMFRYTLKGVPSFEAMSSTSYLMFTNHSDTVALPDNDRRFFVLTNGVPRDVEFWNELNLWLDEDENIAAFADWLETIDLSDYSPYAIPPMTSGKQDMIEFNKSDFDEIVNMTLDALNTSDGTYFTAETVQNAVQQMVYSGRVEDVKNRKNIVKSIIRREAYSVKNSSGQYVRPKIKNGKVMVWTLDRNRAVFDGGTKELRRLVAKDHVLSGDKKDDKPETNVVAFNPYPT